MSLESIVRPALPYQSAVAREKPRNKRSTDEAVITISFGSGKAFSLPNVTTYTVRIEYNRKRHKEIERTFDVARVMNTEDNDQYVDVEVMKKLKYAPSDLAAQKKKVQEANFKPMEVSPNVQIIERNKTRTST